jgi:TIR domain
MGESFYAKVRRALGTVGRTASVPWHLTLQTPDRICTGLWGPVAPDFWTLLMMGGGWGGGPAPDVIAVWVTRDGVPPIRFKSWRKSRIRREFRFALEDFLIENAARFRRSTLGVQLGGGGHTFLPAFRDDIRNDLKHGLEETYTPEPSWEGTPGLCPVYTLGEDLGLAVFSASSRGNPNVPEVKAQLLAGGVILAEISITLPPALLFGKYIKTFSAPANRKIFASYCREDVEVVEAIASYLHAMGAGELLWDARILRSGDCWSAEIYKAIEGADSFQLFWSTYARASENVEKEWRYALELRRPKFIKPVYWQDPLPEPPAELRHLNFSRIKLVTSQ